ncbi:MAG: hypothetical protein JJU05_08500, partial [Verrucomicrobia bacterium]|nr:hypothetical protein [Verrucomicrobiota bacterium]
MLKILARAFPAEKTPKPLNPNPNLNLNLNLNLNPNQTHSPPTTPPRFPGLPGEAQSSHSTTAPQKNTRKERARPVPRSHLIPNPC